MGGVRTDEGPGAVGGVGADEGPGVERRAGVGESGAEGGTAVEGPSAEGRLGVEGRGICSGVFSECWALLLSSSASSANAIEFSTRLAESKLDSTLSLSKNLKGFLVALSQR